MFKYAKCNVDDNRLLRLSAIMADLVVKLFLAAVILDLDIANHSGGRIQNCGDFISSCRTHRENGLLTESDIAVRGKSLAKRLRGYRPASEVPWREDGRGM